MIDSFRLVRESNGARVTLFIPMLFDFSESSIPYLTAKLALGVGGAFFALHPLVFVDCLVPLADSQVRLTPFSAVTSASTPLRMPFGNSLARQALSRPSGSHTVKTKDPVASAMLCSSPQKEPPRLWRCRDVSSTDVVVQVFTFF